MIIATSENSNQLKRQVIGRTAIWRRCFVNIFMRVPLACLGSRAAAVKLWNYQKKKFKKLLLQVAALPSKRLQDPAYWLPLAAWSHILSEYCTAPLG